jgi:hypothetical protein
LAWLPAYLSSSTNPEYAVERVVYLTLREVFCWYSFQYNVNYTFFDVIHAPTITSKQLKLRDPSEGLTPMPKLVLREKSMLYV